LEQTSGHLGTGDLKEGKRPVPPPSEISVKAGSVVFREGDSSREVYIVKQGTLSVLQKRGSQIVELAKLSDRAILGEMSLLDNQPRSATVRAVTDCKLTVIAPITFLAMLKLIPAWLFAVLKVVTHRLREANRKINQHTVPDPLESFCQFLVLKCPDSSAQARHVPAFSWFELVDEFAFLSRLKRDEIQKMAQILMSRGLAKMEQQDFTIPDLDLIDILRAHQKAARNNEPFAPAHIDTLTQMCLAALANIRLERFDSLESMLSLVQKSVEAHLSISHLHKLIELGIATHGEHESLAVDLHRLDWMIKATQELPRILGNKDAR